MKQTKEPLVSVIIVNLNGLKHLRECFNSLFALTYKNIEIIFVDNGSSDNSIKFLEENYKNVKIIKLDKNYGFAEPNNIGLAHSKGKYIVLLNNDTVVDENWITELVKVAESSDDIGVVASKIYYYDRKNVVNFAGGCIDRFGLLMHLSTKLDQYRFTNTQTETFYALGAAELIRRDLCQKIGLFDPIYFAYYEDIDISWLAWILGYRVIFSPKAIIYHKTCQVLGKKYDKIFYLHERNKIRTILKNFDSPIVIVPAILGTIKMRLTEIIKHLINLDRYAGIYIRNYYKVILWNIVHFKSLLIQRKKIKLYRKRGDKEILELIDHLKKYYLNVFDTLKKKN